MKKALCVIMPIIFFVGIVGCSVKNNCEEGVLARRFEGYAQFDNCEVYMDYENNCVYSVNDENGEEKSYALKSDFSKLMVDDRYLYFAEEGLTRQKVYRVNLRNGKTSCSGKNCCIWNT